MVRRSVPALALVLLLPWAARAEQGPAPAAVSVCFTPGPESCAGRIVESIDTARSKVRGPARHRRDQTARPDVAVILDKSQDRRNSARSRYTGATYLANAGVPVWIDDAPAIAHNKVIILDDRTVLTGSFNFTRAADERNAEKVVAIDSPEVAGWFNRNWEGRRAVSRVFEAE